MYFMLSVTLLPAPVTPGNPWLFYFMCTWKCEFVFERSLFSCCRWDGLHVMHNKFNTNSLPISVAMYVSWTLSCPLANIQKWSLLYWTVFRKQHCEDACYVQKQNLSHSLVDLELRASSTCEEHILKMSLIMRYFNFIEFHEFMCWVQN